MYDSLFSFDVGSHTSCNFYLNCHDAENDIRHFLLTFSMAPFALIPYAISKVLWFVPNIYMLLLSFVQIFVMVYSVLRMILLFIDKENFGLMQICIYLFCVITSTVVINMLAVEKFAYAMFFIIETVALSYENKKEKWIMFILALSSLTTNIFLLPILLFTEKKTWKEYFLTAIKIGFMYLVLIMITGQFNLVLNSYTSWDKIKVFAGVNQEYTFVEKLMQVFIFIANTIFVPKGYIEGILYRQIEPSFDFMCIIGIVIFIFAVIGFILNRKDKFAKICVYWLGFMLFLLIVVGWGSALNEMFIYSSIFAWSIIYLLYKFIASVVRRKTLIKILLFILIITVLSYNICEIITIMKFSMKYYPSIL